MDSKNNQDQPSKFIKLTRSEIYAVMSSFEKEHVETPSE